MSASSDPPSTVSAQRRLLLFGKIPFAGRAKTRLVPALGEEGAARLYQAFLDDAVAAWGCVGGASLELWLEPREAEDPETPGRDGRIAPARTERELRSRYPDVRLRWQTGEELGSRLRGAFDKAFREGAGRVVAVGSDHPTLPTVYLHQAFRTLERCGLVLGPSRDGGYYALGLRLASWPMAAELFRGIPWSTPRVLQATRERASGLGLRWEELPAWYDVDEPADLERLRREVRAGTHTSAVLERLAGPGIGGRKKRARSPAPVRDET